MFNLEGRAMRTRDVGGSAWRGSESSWGSGCLLRMVYVEVATVGLVDKNIYLCSCAIMHVQAPLLYFLSQCEQTTDSPKDNRLPAAWCI